VTTPEEAAGCSAIEWTRAKLDRRIAERERIKGTGLAKIEDLDREIAELEAILDDLVSARAESEELIR
jgi:hypothetical protein